MQTIDITPSWSAVGEIYIRLAESNEQKALRAMSGEIRKAFAIASAAVALSKGWSESEKAAFNALVKSRGERCENG